MQSLSGNIFLSCHFINLKFATSFDMEESMILIRLLQDVIGADFGESDIVRKNLTYRVKKLNETTDHK